MTRTSIVVPTRGGRDRLPVLLDGLARQTDTDLEVLVVVDGDVDDTEELVARRTDLDVRAIVFPENRGRSAALNAGFAAARGEILVRMDDDLDPEPSYVAGQVAAHAGEPRGVVGLCRNVYPDTAYAEVYGAPMDLRSRAAAYATSARARLAALGRQRLGDPRRLPAGRAATTRATAATAGRTSTGATGCTCSVVRSWCCRSWRWRTTSPPPRPPCARCAPTTPASRWSGSRTSTA